MLLFVATVPAFSQVPTIYDLTPESGPVGTPVLIEGANFASDVSALEVLFGTVRAQITSTSSTTIEVIVPAGAAYDLVTVRNFNDARTGYSPRPFMVTFAGSGEIGIDSFLPKIDLNIGISSGANELAAGDIDGDGKIDLVSANTTAGTVSIFRNISTDTGPLTSASFAAPVSLETGAVWAIEVADLDSDGKPDIIATVPSEAKVIVLRNVSTPGAINAGSFSSKIEYPTPSGGYGLAIGDVNGDAKPELVVTNTYAGTVSVLQNAAYGGSFNVNTFSPRTDFTTGAEPMDVALADIDADGFMDLIVANRAAHTFSVLRGLDNSGTTTTSSFTSKQDYYTGTGPTSIMLSDLDQNDKLDVVTSNASSHTVCINMNLTQPGQLDGASFGPRTQLSTGFQPKKLAIADLDGDGFPDAATANDHVDQSVALFENSNIPDAELTNTFLPKKDLSAGSKVSGLVIADFNKDGKPDIGVSSATGGTLSLFVNGNVPGSATPAVSFFSPASGNFLDRIIIQGSNFSVVPTSNLVKFNGLQARVISSSTTSITVEVPFHATTGKISVQVNGLETATGANDFTVYQIPSISGFSPISGVVGAVVTINGTNFSTAKADNVVYFGATRATVTSATQTQLSVVVPKGATFKPITVAVHGVMASSARPFTVTFSNPPLATGSFAHRTNLSTLIESPQDGSIGDIDGDGKPDLVICGTDKISLFRNISTPGALNTGSFAPAVNITPGTTTPYMFDLKLEDLDADGKLDLMVADYGHGFVSFFRNVSSPGSISALSFAAPINIPIDDNTHNFGVSDLDGDGKPDIVASALHNNWVVSVVKNTSITGSYSFASSVPFTTGGNSFDLALGDLDGDGRVDIAFPNVSNFKNVSVFRNTGTQGVLDINSFASPVSFATFQFPSALSVGDLDGDGKMDIVAATEVSTGARSISVLRNTSTVGSISSGSFAPKVDLSIGSDPRALALSDVDGDGKVDIVSRYCGSYTCPIVIYRNISSPGSLTTGSFETKKDIAGSLGGNFILVGDVDGDGKPDIVSGGDNVLAIMQDLATAPTVSGFSPQTGPVGTTVTITGTNFSTTPVDNQVSFNGEAAVVTSSSSTSIDAVVPITAETGPISVTRYGLTATSAAIFTVIKSSQVITFPALSPRVFGTGTFTLTGTSSSGLPVSYSSSNPAIATIAGNIMTITGAGTTTITAIQNGDHAYYPASEVERTLVIDKAQQTISFDALVEKQSGDIPFALAGTVSSGLPLSYQSSDASVATVSLNIVTIRGVGTTSITATQPGDSNYEAASPVVRALVVSKLSQQITFNVLPSKVFGDNNFNLSGASSAGLPLRYSSSNPDVATVSANMVTITGAGTATITADQDGDNQYNAATPVTQVLTVNKAQQSISFASIAEKEVDDDPFGLDAASSSGLPVSFNSSDATVATVDGNVVTIRGEGTTSITAAQTGNDNYEPATPVSRVLDVKLVTAIEAPSEDDIHLFPNPASSSITLSCGGCRANAEVLVIVYDNYGRNVMQTNMTDHKELRLEVEHLPSGIYSLHVIQGNETRYRKIVKH